MESTSKKQRILELDVLRGVSLFGILLMNILVFSFPYQHVRLDQVLTGVNGFLFRIVSLFVIDSFYPIFSFLFGMSLILIYKSTQKREIAFKPVMLRRLIFLAFLGLLHGFFLYSGDILFTYAVMGCVAMWLTQLSVQRLKLLSILLFSVKVVIWGLPYLILGWFSDTQLPLSGGTHQDLLTVLHARTSVHYIDFFLYNAHDNLTNLLMTVTIDWLDVFPYLLLGIAAMKGDIVTWVKQHPSATVQWASLFTIIGVIVKFLGAYAITNPGYMIFSFTVGGPLLSVGIVLFFFHIMQYRHIQRALKVFRYPGKMSLSVYLSQTVICVLFFAGFGLGFYNQLPLYQTYLFAIGLFVVQVIFCYFYLQSRQQGPIEWIWRKVTYYKRKSISE